MVVLVGLFDADESFGCLMAMVIALSFLFEWREESLKLSV